MNIMLVGAGVALAALAVVVLLILVLLGHRGPAVLWLLGLALLAFLAGGTIVWRAFSALARM